jgi:ABC-type multidrug transport system fused ATPase/permease subunit
LNFFLNIIKKQFKSFAIFYSYLSNKIFISLSLSLMVGLLDGFGLAMFLPLIQMVAGSGDLDSSDLGIVSFLPAFFNSIGIVLSLKAVLLTLMIFFIIKGIIKYFEGVYSIKLQQLFIVLIRKKCVNTLLDFQFASFVKTDAGKIQNTLSTEVQRVLAAYKSYFLAIQNGVFVVVYVVLAFITNSQFAVFVAIGGLLSNLMFSAIYKKTKVHSKEVSKFNSVYQRHLIETVNFFKYLKATGYVDRYKSHVENSIHNIESINTKIGINSSLLNSLREPVVIIIIVSVMILQITLFNSPLGLIILSLMFFYRALTYITFMQNQWNSFLSVSGSLDNMVTFLNELGSKKDITGTTVINSFNSEITLYDIWFSYKKDDWILKGITISLKKNQTIAFVGASGSGKTTLINIISGLLQANKGTMKIDGVDTREINIKTFQNRIGYITQEPVIFNDSIFNNVTFWDNPTAENQKRFWNVCHQAAIFEFVQSLPDKENAPLGSSGIMISGGQKQRISIARELYKNSDILILDEATSALDAETELAIQENTNQMKGHATVLIVAHRLSTIREADLIILMDGGEIVDTGNFETLMQTNAHFKRMTELQQL